ncbi:MAG TPA: type VI secretion system-associated protein TagF, partial [Ramlibacter sp.]|nr:type VI secretion system-associated protein TagF [Ramlibacter sp.]
WDGWLQRGLALAGATLEGAALRERLGDFAPWRYLALPAPGEAWCGILVASHDRVGRAFPLTLAERLAAPASPHESAARLASLLDAAAQGPEALEAAIAALPPRSEQQFKPGEAWPPPPASLWWPLAAAHDGTARAAAWPPEPGLLLELLGIQAAEHHTASAE